MFGAAGSARPSNKFHSFVKAACKANSERWSPRVPHEAPQKSAWSSASWNRTPISREIKSLYNDISTYHVYSVLNKSKSSNVVMDSPPESPLSDRKLGRLFSEHVGWHRNVLEDETCDILQRRIRPIVFSKTDSIRVSISDIFCRFLISYTPLATNLRTKSKKYPNHVQLADASHNSF
jgi:hypothetical protein